MKSGVKEVFTFRLFKKKNEVPYQ